MDEAEAERIREAGDSWKKLTNRYLHERTAVGMTAVQDLADIYELEADWHDAEAHYHRVTAERLEAKAIELNGGPLPVEDEEPGNIESVGRDHLRVRMQDGKGFLASREDLRKLQRAVERGDISKENSKYEFSFCLDIECDICGLLDMTRVPKEYTVVFKENTALIVNEEEDPKSVKAGQPMMLMADAQRYMADHYMTEHKIFPMVTTGMSSVAPCAFIRYFVLPRKGVDFITRKRMEEIHSLLERPTLSDGQVEQLEHLLEVCDDILGK